MQQDNMTQKIIAFVEGKTAKLQMEYLLKTQISNATVTVETSNTSELEIFKTLARKFNLYPGVTPTTMPYDMCILAFDMDAIGKFSTYKWVKICAKYWPELLQRRWINIFWYPFIFVKSLPNNCNTFSSFKEAQRFNQEFAAICGTEERQIQVFKGTGGVPSNLHIVDYLKWVDLTQTEPKNNNTMLAENVSSWEVLVNNLREYEAYRLNHFSMNLLDGCHRLQRMIIYVGITKYAEGFRDVDDYIRKMDRFQHTSVKDTIKFCANYVGLKNIKFFQTNGYFGSRASQMINVGTSKYLQIQSHVITNFVFPQFSMEAVDNECLFNIAYEPKCLLPILPLQLCKHFNPREVAGNILAMLDQQLTGIKLVPYCKGFYGHSVYHGEHAYFAPAIAYREGKYKILDFPLQMTRDEYIQNMETLLRQKKITAYGIS